MEISPEHRTNNATRSTPAAGQAWLQHKIFYDIPTVHTVGKARSAHPVPTGWAFRMGPMGRHLPWFNSPYVVSPLRGHHLRMSCCFSDQLQLCEFFPLR